jgi:hypothetical protein
MTNDDDKDALEAAKKAEWCGDSVERAYAHHDMTKGRRAYGTELSLDCNAKDDRTRYNGGCTREKAPCSKHHRLGQNWMGQHPPSPCRHA